jgi:hypothetical protein
MDTSKYDLKCKAGTTFRKQFTFKTRHDNLWDFTGFTARMQVRANIDAEDVLVELKTEYVENPPVSGAYGTITIDTETATLSLFISDEFTSTFPIGSYLWDIEIVSPGGDVDCPLEGKFKVTGEITR